MRITERIRALGFAALYLQVKEPSPDPNLELLYDYLKRHQVEAATIYPGYKGVIKSIKEHQAFMSAAHEKKKKK